MASYLFHEVEHLSFAKGALAGQEEISEKGSEHGKVINFSICRSNDPNFAPDGYTIVGRNVDGPASNGATQYFGERCFKGTSNKNMEHVYCIKNTN